MVLESNCPRPPTLVVINNELSEAVTEGTVKEQHSKSINMNIYWLQDQIKHQYFKLH